MYCAIYTSFIRPIFYYCDTIYHCCCEANSKSLEKLQRRAKRVVCKSYDSDTAMISLKWGTLISKREHHTFSLVKKCISDRCPQFFGNYFSFNKTISSRVTRKSNLLHLLRVRTEIAKGSF